jgi:hypothetical protein
MGTKRAAQFIRSNLLGLVAIFIALGGTAAATQVVRVSSGGNRSPARTTRVIVKQPAVAQPARKKKKAKRGPAGPQGPPGAAGAAATVEPWHVVGASGEPTLNAAWTQLGSGAGLVAFRKDSVGRVYLSGRASFAGAWNGTPMFTLPSGYRPAKLSWIPIVGQNQTTDHFAAIDINGDVIPAGGGSGFAVLDGASFFLDLP